MSFETLPFELKNIVSDFAFKCKWSETKKSLEMCDKITDLGISPLFLRRKMWSWSYGAFLPSPLYAFEPIERYTGRWADLVDWHCVNELLFRLDYRRVIVRAGGTRHEWFERFRLNWLNIQFFDTFYRIVVTSGLPCYKPIYQNIGASQLTSWNSPVMSARWVLEDYDTFGSF